MNENPYASPREQGGHVDFFGEWMISFAIAVVLVVMGIFTIYVAVWQVGAFTTDGGVGLALAGGALIHAVVNLRMAAIEFMGRKQCNDFSQSS